MEAVYNVARRGVRAWPVFHPLDHCCSCLRSVSPSQSRTVKRGSWRRSHRPVITLYRLRAGPALQACALGSVSASTATSSPPRSR